MSAFCNVNVIMTKLLISCSHMLDWSNGISGICFAYPFAHACKSGLNASLNYRTDGHAERMPGTKLTSCRPSPKQVAVNEPRSLWHLTNLRNPVGATPPLDGSCKTQAVENRVSGLWTQRAALRTSVPKMRERLNFYLVLSIAALRNAAVRIAHDARGCH